MNKFYTGSAIAITLLAVAAMTTITLGVAQLVPKDFKQAQSLENALNAENAAWAGVEHALLELKKDPYFEISKELKNGQGRPYGAYPEQCISRLACPGMDRQLGIPMRQTPYDFNAANNLLQSSPDTYYSLVVWHSRQNIGNLNDINDGLGSDASRTPNNINPILEKDEVRRLDMTNAQSTSGGLSGQITITWKPVFTPTCQQQNKNFHVVYSWLDAEGNLLTANGDILDGTRDILTYTGAGSATSSTIAPPSQAQAKQLALRFVALDTAQANDDRVKTCFMRYVIKNSGTGSSIETSDLGFNVIESTGVSGGVRRKVRVIANRENGNIINILDFGIVCQTCQNL